MYCVVKTMLLLFQLMSLPTHLVYKCALSRYMVYGIIYCQLYLDLTEYIFYSINIHAFAMGRGAGRRVRSPATGLWKRMWSKLRAILNIEVVADN